MNRPEHDVKLLVLEKEMSATIGSYYSYLKKDHPEYFVCRVLAIDSASNIAHGLVTEAKPASPYQKGDILKYPVEYFGKTFLPTEHYDDLDNWV